MSFFSFQQIESKPFFEGECIPNLDTVKSLFTDLDDTKYPHAWRGAVVCFVFGLALMILTDLFALLTVCCRSCICCSVFTICGSIQSFASILFTLGKKTFYTIATLAMNCKVYYVLCQLLSTVMLDCSISSLLFYHQKIFKTPII